MNTFIPFKTLCTKDGSPQWWTPECEEALLKKDRAWKAERQDIITAKLKAAFTHTTNRAIGTQVRARTAWDNSIRLKLSASRLSERQWWSTLKHAAGNSRNSGAPTLIGETGQE